jgi:hypothetical protein
MPATNELDSRPRVAASELVGDGQSGEEMASRATSGNDDLLNFVLLINSNAATR